MTTIREWLRKRRRLAIAAAVAAIAPVVAFFVLDAAFPFPVERLRDAMATRSVMVCADDGSLVSWRVDRDESWRLPTGLDDVSPWLVDATIAVEDKRFRRHIGVDPVAALRAVAGNLMAGRTVSGASTLTMQTVRLLWQRPRRLSSKFVEAFRAVQLERAVGKRGVLELYFNLAPYGGNIVGAEAAARRYFGKSARSLTLGEASLLAGIPQSPSRLSPRRNSELALRRRWQVLHCMLNNGMISREQAGHAAGESVDLETPSARPGLVHFADWTRRALPNADGAVRTTLKLDWQDTVERVVRRNAPRWQGRGLSGPAVVVLAAGDSSILAYLGNTPGAPGWQVDGARAPRQPGSLLKPFLFATLADRGLLDPATRVRDMPTEWNGYAPRNIDREWSGDISAGEALRQSRNVPAVAQLSRLGIGTFAGVMERIGLAAGDPARQGLAMALGAREQRLVDLVNAYAALGRLGVWMPVKLRDGDANAAEGRRVWSEEAAWLTLSALSRPSEAPEPTLVWKTGTSWNHRDAWAVIVSREAVIGVWIGRSGGNDGPRVTGGDASLPLALELAEALNLGRGSGWTPPPGIAFADVCPVSGHTPGWNCPELVSTPVIAANRAARTCAVHIGGDAAADAGDAEGASGARTASTAPLKLVSPSHGTEYIMTGEGGAGDTLAFRAESPLPGASLYWFVDGRLVATSGRGETCLWRMEPGGHVLTVSDDAGRNRTAVFSVTKKEDIGYR